MFDTYLCFFAIGECNQIQFQLKISAAHLMTVTLEHCALASP